MEKIDFEDTRIAFASKTMGELRRAYLLFYAIHFNWLVSFGTAAIRLALRIKLPIKALVKATLFKQFCGGQNINDCSRTSAKLWQYKIGTILDYSVEGKANEASFDATEREILATIEKAAHSVEIPFCVFKTTGLANSSVLEKVTSRQALSAAEQASWERTKARVNRICEAAAKSQVRVFMDAEETWLQGAIDELAINMMRLYNRQMPIVYNTYQLYLTSKLAQLKADHQISVNEGFWFAVKLVRGAYMEKERERAAKMGYPSPIQPNKDATDRDYNLALLYCIENKANIALCAGSHNEASTAYLTELMHRYGVKPSDPNFYFSQLYGMSDHISYNLSHWGYNVAKYVPYGPVEDVLPYLFRRAAENTSVKGQSSRELRLIKAELNRRKTNP